MKTIIEYRLIYNRRGKLNKEGKALIQIEVYQNRKRKYFSTGIYIKPNQWDDKRKIVKSHPEAQRLNMQLFEQIKRLRDFETEMRTQNGEFDISMFEILKHREVYNFWEMFDHYMHTQNVSKSRKYYINRTIKYLKEFNPNLTFKNFNLQTIYEFDAFLRSKHLHTNTILQHHKITKHFLNLMVKNKIIKENPYRLYQIKREKSERVYLTEEELAVLESINLDKNNKKLRQVLDLFLFSCYTGLRFSDIQSLTSKHIEETEGEISIRIRQKKTGDFVSIPLDLLFRGKAIRILEKYKNAGQQRIFPKMTNQEANRQLKLIQAYAGLQKVLTFHVARHTFGTLLAKYTHDPYLIRDLMGHSDIQTSMVYIHLSNAHIKERLKKVRWE